MYFLAVLILLLAVAVLITICVSWYRREIKHNADQVESIWGTPPTPFDRK